MLRTGDPIGQGSRHGQSRTPEPLEFVEVPISGSRGSSYEPDSYTPRGDLTKAKPASYGSTPMASRPEQARPSNASSRMEQGKAKPKRRGFFGSLFGG
jgi:hypothetical protein